MSETGKAWIIAADPKYTKHEGGAIITTGATVYGDSHVIVPATAVPTAEEVGAMRWWAYNDTGPDPGSPEFDEACERASAVLRAYLERQR